MIKYVIASLLFSSVSFADCTSNQSANNQILRTIASADQTQTENYSSSQKKVDQTARQGCCSHHNGVCGCSNGRAACCDGSYSPSCGCN